MENNSIVKPRRGEIWMADLQLAVGCEQSGIRPVLIMQNDKGNMHAPTTQIVPISASTTKKRIPTHVNLDANRCGLLRDSVALVEQQRVIDNQRLMYRVSEVDVSTMRQLEIAAMISIGIEFTYIQNNNNYMMAGAM
jgi:mRNA interferase MazF